MSASGDRRSDPSLVLLVLEGLDAARLHMDFDDPAGGRLKRQLGDFERLRFDFVPVSGRLGVACTIATGATPEQHGVVGTREPDEASREIRAVDARTWRMEPFWSTLVGSGRSATVIGWPAIEPVDAWSTENGSGRSNSMLVGSGSYESRDDPQDAWLLPPRSVSPESIRELVRKHRVHSKGLDNSDVDDASSLSTIALARELSRLEQTDVLACWYSPDHQADVAAPDHLSMRFEVLIQALTNLSGTGSIAVVCLPSLGRISGLNADVVSGSVFVQRKTRNTYSLPPVVRDQDLVPTLFKMSNLPFERKQLVGVSLEKARSRANQRARKLLESGLVSSRSHARQRVYTNVSGTHAAVKGLDLFMRREYENARRWMEEALRCGGGAPAVLVLLRILIATGDKDRLDRLARSTRSVEPISLFVEAGAALVNGESARAAELLQSLSTRNVGETVLAIEMALRAGDPEAACVRFGSMGRLLVRSGHVRALRLGLIAARRASRSRLQARLARVLLRLCPDQVRRHRFLRED